MLLDSIESSKFCLWYSKLQTIFLKILSVNQNKNIESNCGNYRVRIQSIVLFLFILVRDLLTNLVRDHLLCSTKQQQQQKPRKEKKTSKFVTSYIHEISLWNVFSSEGILRHASTKLQGSFFIILYITHLKINCNWKFDN